MDELMKQLQAKTGLGVDQIKSVLDGVKDFLGDKLPGPLAGQVNKFLGDDDAGATGGGEGDGGGLIDQAKDRFGGLTGGGH